MIMGVIPRTDIHISITIEGKTFHVTTFRGEYRNLMTLLYDRFYVEGFGECKGTGRCGTCHVHLTGSDNELLTRVGNENTTLSKMTGVSDNSRLACQLMIDEKLDGLAVEVLFAGEN